MDSKLKAVFSPRLRPGGNKTVLNTMFVYFTSGGCHYLREKKKIKKGFASDFNDFPVFQHDFRTFIFGEVLIFQDYFIPCRCAGPPGEEESCQNFRPCFGGTCKEFWHLSLVFLVNKHSALNFCPILRAEVLIAAVGLCQAKPGECFLSLRASR